MRVNKIHRVAVAADAAGSVEETGSFFQSSGAMSDDDSGDLGFCRKFVHLFRQAAPNLARLDIGRERPARG